MIYKHLIISILIIFQFSSKSAFSQDSLNWSNGELSNNYYTDNHELILCTDSIRKKDTIYNDFSDINIRIVDNQVFDKYRGSKFFKYEDNSYKAISNTFLDKLWEIIKHFFRKIFSVLEMHWIYKVLAYAFAILFIIMLILKTKFYKLFYSQSDNKEIDYFENEYIPENQDLDQLIKIEVNNANYRKAIRYLYLKLMKTLKDNSLINFSKEKTNFDYYKEIANQSQLAYFKELTNIYYYVWYGNFLIDRQIYSEFECKFVEFFKLTNAQKE